MALARNLRMMVKADLTQATFNNFLGWGGNDIANQDATVTITQAIRQTTQALTLSAVSISGTTVTYTGTITGGGSNAYAGWAFAITGFVNPANNITFIVTASSTSVLQGTVIQQVAETHAGTATSASTTTAYLMSDPRATAGIWIGRSLLVNGFTNAGNNLLVGSSAPSIIASDDTSFAVTNSGGVNETHAATGYPNTCGNTFFLTQAIRQSSVTYTISSVNTSGVFVGVGMTGLANTLVLISGFANPQNNGYFMITSSTSTSITVASAVTISETIAATAVSSSTYTTYLGTIPSGVASATQSQGGQAGSVYTISSFSNPGNNNTFQVLASSAAAFGVVNGSGVNETPSANVALCVGVSGFSWALRQMGYITTTDGGQMVWKTLTFPSQITTANGNGGAGTTTYTLSVTPTGVTIGQIFTVTGTTNFNGSFVIQSVNAGAKTVTVTATNANTTESAITATGKVLAMSRCPAPASSAPTFAASNTLLYNQNPISGAAAAGTNHHFPTKFQGVWSSTKIYRGYTAGAILNGLQYAPSYPYNDLVWNNSADPNYYVCLKQAGWNIISVTGNNTTITYTIGTTGQGAGPAAIAHNVAINERITVTGCTTSLLNVIGAVVTSVAANTITVTVAGFNTTEAETASVALAVVIPTVVSNNTNDNATSAHWVPFGYEVFQSNDGATPYYFKLEYGSPAVNSPGLLVQYGTGTDGNGGMTGTLSYREWLCQSAPSSNTALHEWCFFGTGSGANLVIAGPRDAGNTATPGLVWTTERSKNTSGVDTSNYITYAFGFGVSSTNWFWHQNSLPLTGAVYNNICPGQMASYPGQASQAGVNSSLFTIGMSASLSSFRFGLAGSAPQAVLPIFPLVGGFDHPLTNLVGLQRGPTAGIDTVDNTIFTTTMYGTTMTYLMTDMGSNTGVHSFPSATGSTSVGMVAIRWEA